MLEDDRRTARRHDWLEDLRQDLRFGIRAAARAPLFSLLAIATLALGIGANAAVFGVVKSVLLDALPYADADRLVRIYARWTSAPTEAQSVSPGVATDFATRLPVVLQRCPVQLLDLRRRLPRPVWPARPPAAFAGGTFFQTLGVRPALGRAFTARDAGAATAMLSDAAWRREFGGDPGVIGRTLTIDGDPIEVVGVLPRGFVGPMGDADVWFSLDLAPMLRTPETARGQHWLGVVARLAPGVTPNAAQRELDRLGADLARRIPGHRRRPDVLGRPAAHGNGR